MSWQLSRISNSKNTKGQSLLDYILFIHEKNGYTKAEEPALNEFVGFLCKSGAEYAQVKKKCPGEYLRVP
jgi:hypothetical protein